MKALKITGVLLAVIAVAIILFVGFYQPPRFSDYGIFENLRIFTKEKLGEYGAVRRPVSKDFENYVLTLSFPYSKLFGDRAVGVPLESFENPHITAATISQFEVPAGSGYYRDFTFNLRPRFEYKAPVFHIDFMKPSPGVPGLCSMDFFNVDPDAISLEAFFGDTIAEIQKAMELVEKYQRTKEQGRGKITAYLDPWKSQYRMELQEPNKNDEAARRKYYEAVSEAYKTALSAYLTSLQKLSPDPAYTKQHEEKTRAFVQALYDKDFAVNMGKKIFKNDFQKYWIDGFWTVAINLNED